MNQTVHETAPPQTADARPAQAPPRRAAVARRIKLSAKGLRSNGRLLFGTIVLAFFLLFGFVLPLFAPANVTTWNLLPNDLPPSGSHLLGTTDLGQDTFWFLALAVRNSLIVGFTVAALSTAVGVLVGVTAGFAGGIVDRLLMLITDTFIVIPGLPILILTAAILKGRASLLVISLMLAVFNWPWPARQARAMALSLREREFVNTAWFSGEGTARIIATQIFPYMRAWTMANFVNAVLVAIGAEAGLAVLGLSNVQRATLGTMIYWAMQQQALLIGAWYWIMAPVVAIVLLFVGLFGLSTGLVQRSALARGFGRA